MQTKEDKRRYSELYYLDEANHDRNLAKANLRCQELWKRGNEVLKWSTLQNRRDSNGFKYTIKRAVADGWIRLHRDIEGNKI